jgi:hypothetical protein
MNLNFNHPVQELIWAINFDSLTDDEKKRYAEKQERHEKYINILNDARQLKKNMDKLTKKISKARKIYRIDNTLLNLEKLNKYEMEYRKLYNSYWYDSIYKLGDFR